MPCPPTNPGRFTPTMDHLMIRASDEACSGDGGGNDGSAAFGWSVHLVNVWYDKPDPGIPIVCLMPLLPMLMLAPRGPNPRFVPELLKFNRMSFPKRTVFLKRKPMMNCPHDRLAGAARWLLALGIGRDAGVPAGLPLRASFAAGRALLSQFDRLGHCWLCSACRPRRVVGPESRCG